MNEVDTNADGQLLLIPLVVLNQGVGDELGRECVPHPESGQIRRERARRDVDLVVRKSNGKRDVGGRTRGHVVRDRPDMTVEIALEEGQGIQHDGPVSTGIGEPSDLVRVVVTGRNRDVLTDIEGFVESVEPAEEEKPEAIARVPLRRER